MFDPTKSRGGVIYQCRLGLSGSEGVTHNGAPQKRSYTFEILSEVNLTSVVRPLVSDIGARRVGEISLCILERSLETLYVSRTRKSSVGIIPKGGA